MSTATPIAPVAAPPPPALPVGRLVSVGAVIFFANAAMLVLQLVAGRLLAPFIGSSLETWTSIIGVFLAGIALGNGFGGKLADRYPTPRTLVALLAISALAALWMLAFPMLLGASGFHKSLGLTARIPILAAMLCLPVGFVLSLLTPLAIKLGLPDVAHTGRVAGLIFSLSTLGCLIGNYLTGFYLIPAFTTNMLVVVSAGVLLALAGVALVMVRGQEAASAARGPTPQPPPCREGEKVTGVSDSLADSMSPSSSPSLDRRGSQGEPAGGSPYPTGGGWGVGSSPRAPSFAFADIRRAYLIVFLASFCGMTLELTASRVLAQAVGVSLFTWTGVIGVMLAGTALGNFVGGQLADRPRQTGTWMAGVVILLSTVALAVLVSLVVAYDRGLPVEHSLGIPARYWAKYRAAEITESEFQDEVRLYYSEALPAMLPEFQRLLAAGVAVGLLLGGVLAFGPIRWMGRAPADSQANPRYTLAATLCGGSATIVLYFVARVYLTRFGLFTTWDPIPQVMVWTFTLFFLPMFMLGLVSPQVIRLSVPDVAHAGRVAGRVYAWSTVGAIAGTFATGYALLSTVGMDLTVLAVGLVLIGTSLVVAKVWEHNLLLYLFSIALGGVVGGFILLGFGGRDSSIATVESNYYTIKVGGSPQDAPLGTRSLNLDHLLHSVVDPDDPTYLYYTHEHIQMEFLWLARAGSPEPRALVIGGGGYTFPRYALEVMPEARVDVVEIDPQVTRVARQYLGLKDYPNLHVTHMDGRQFVAERAEPGSYDLVIQDAVNDLSVPAHLMTKEYNDAVKVALKPDGAYLLTIIDSVALGKLWKAAMATLGRSFKNVILLSAHDLGEKGSWQGDKWERDRQVLVIYASDRPFSPEALWSAVPEKVSAAGVVHAVARSGQLLDLSGGVAPGAIDFLLAVRASLKLVYTVPVPPERLKPFTDREAGVVLTDQYCPVDNLMADVFRNRYK